MEEINTWTAWETAKAIKKRVVSSEEVAEACLSRIQAREDDVKAWAHLNPAKVLQRMVLIISKGVDPFEMPHAPLFCVMRARW